MSRIAHLNRTRFIVAGGSAAFAIATSPASAAEFTYKLAHNLPDSHPIGVGVREMAAAIKRESNGRLEIRVFPDSQLGGDSSVLTQLRAGALEILLQGQGTLATIAPVMNAGYLGFAYTSSKMAIAAMEGDLGDIFHRELEAKGLHAFKRVWEAGLRQVTTSGHAIRNAEDLVGLKLRVPISPITVDMFKALGASPIGLNLNEIYTALQTKIVDGAEGPYVNIFAQKLYEVQHYLSVTNHQWSGYWFVVGGDAWKALPPDLQNVLSRNAEIYAVREQRTAGIQNVSVADVLVRYGMQRNTAETASIRAKLGGYFDKWKKEFGPAVWGAIEKYCGKLG